MISLVYVSAASHLLAPDELSAILRRSRENNTEKGITGMLLYVDGNFMQAIEGDATAVDALFGRVMQDPRHGHVIQLLRRPIAEREFGSWSMAFREIRDLPAEDRTGCGQFLASTLRHPAPTAQGEALSLLESLRSSML
jgi:hypothetical protein